MRPKAREMTQHGGPPGWLDKSDPARWVLRWDRRSMPPSLMDRTACPGLELLSCELLTNPAAVVDVLVLNVHKTPSRKEGMGQNYCKTLSVSLLPMAKKQIWHALHASCIHSKIHASSRRPSPPDEMPIKASTLASGWVARLRQISRIWS